MGRLAHQLDHPMNGRGRRALTPLAMVLLTLGGLMLPATSAPAADRNVSAAAAQYPVAAQAPSVTPPTDGGATIPLGEETAPVGESLPEAAVTPAVAADEAASSPGGGREFRLPFTGQLVQPLLIAGMVLLMSGLAMRRRVQLGRIA